MNSLSHHPPRAPRVRPTEFTPAVLRAQDGGCFSGELEIFSITGGLLALPKPLNQGSRVKLMFLTQTGPVFGVAEMLRPVSWGQQPFRFIVLYENDERRLRAASQPIAEAAGAATIAAPAPVAPAAYIAARAPVAPVARLAAAAAAPMASARPLPSVTPVAAVPPVVAAKAVAASTHVPTWAPVAPAVPERSAPVPLPSFAPAEREQEWIEKYRAATSRPRQSGRQFFRVFLGAVTVATLFLGTMYAFHMLR